MWWRCWCVAPHLCGRPCSAWDLGDRGDAEAELSSLPQPATRDREGRIAMWDYMGGMDRNVGLQRGITTADVTADVAGHVVKTVRVFADVVVLRGIAGAAVSFRITG